MFSLKKIMMILLVGLCAVVSRLFPHLPNTAPLLSLGFIAGAVTSRIMALIFMAVTTFFSDLLLAYVYHQPLFGSWSLFTYSGILTITILGSYSNIENQWLRPIAWGTATSIGYWLWTNFGTWLFSGMYTLNTTGFMNCYEMALPFLQYQIIGSILWLTVIHSMLSLVFWNKKDVGSPSLQYK